MYFLEHIHRETYIYVYVVMNKSVKNRMQSSLDKKKTKFHFCTFVGRQGANLFCNIYDCKSMCF